MKAPVNRLPLGRLHKQIWMLPASCGTWRNCHTTLAMSGHKVDFLPELPPAPSYPCPFITAMDMHTYVLPLYRFGWGISRVPINTSGTKKPPPPATRLSKRIILPNTDIARKIVKEITSTVIEPENHHPILEQQIQGALSVVDIHVHTHTARAPSDCQDMTFTRKCPGITHRDIRFAILIERLLRDYGLVSSPASLSYPQPTDIESVHDFGALLPKVRDSAEK